MKVASLFSGAGGLDLGFIQAGHDIIWAIDNYEDAVKTYKRNIGNHIILDDIAKIPSTNIPDHDILIGGFPCQGFSIANIKRNKHDTRNKLYLEMLRIIIEKKPKSFLAENVKGILSLAKGKAFEMILNEFNNAGYNVSYQVLNAADYGVPQIRYRVFIIGIRNDISFSFNFPDQTHSNNTSSNGLKPWVSIGEVLKEIPEPEEKHNLMNHTYSNFKLKFNGYLGNREIDPQKPAPTVTARGDNKGGVVVLHHPNNHRRMSARELAITQSFPIDFIFEGCRSSIYRQIGNAVPPLLAYHIAKQFPLDVYKYENKSA
ncbi:MAG: DNA cytosine methyltransferase [Ignavibacteriales bacterium]|nr:DNA cytosine methyltransferase [Ignavibacteriales bacterium]